MRSKSPANTLFRLMGLLLLHSWRMMGTVVMGTATIASSIGLMTTSAFLIAKAALQPSIADLQLAIVGVRFFGISRGILRYLERIVSHDTTFHILAQMRAWFFEALEPLAPARLVHDRSGDLLVRIISDTQTLENVFLRVLAPPIVAVLIAVLTTTLIGWFSLDLALAFLIFLLVAGLGIPVLADHMSRALGKRLVETYSGLAALIVDGIQGLADLLAYGGQNRYWRHAHALGEKLGRLQVQMAHVHGVHSALIGLMTNCATVAVLFLAIPLVRSELLDGVHLALIVLAVLASFESILPLPEAFERLGHSLAAANRLFEIIDREPIVQDPGEPLPWPPQAGWDIKVSNLRFSYDHKEPPALDGLTFSVSEKTCTALVGPSGAGKSTVARLLLRLWDYHEGHILVGGHELKAYHQDHVRRSVAVVSQTTTLFTATIRENLLIARPDAKEEDLHQAAEKACIREFIESLPHGYDTWLGEQGQQLSEGQRQRLAIARAMLQDAPLLILDEPTANLDATTEKQVWATLQSLIHDRTCLLITHRMMGLEFADEILVLREGTIVERGKHTDLVQMHGFYHRMWDLQRRTLCGTTPQESHASPRNGGWG